MCGALSVGEYQFGIDGRILWKQPGPPRPCKGRRLKATQLDCDSRTLTLIASIAAFG